MEDGLTHTKITTFPLRAPVVAQLALELKAVVSNYLGRLSVAETIGVIEVVKLETLNDQPILESPEPKPDWAQEPKP